MDYYEPLPLPLPDVNPAGNLLGDYTSQNLYCSHFMTPSFYQIGTHKSASALLSGSLLSLRQHHYLTFDALGAVKDTLDNYAENKVSNLKVYLCSLLCLLMIIVQVTLVPILSTKRTSKFTC